MNFMISATYKQAEAKRGEQVYASGHRRPDPYSETGQRGRSSSQPCGQ